MKADIEDTKFKAKMAQIKGDTDALNGKTIKPKIDTDGIDKATEKTYHIEKQLQTIDGEEVEVWIRVESKDLDETKDKLNGVITLSNKPNTLQIKTDDDEVEATLNTLVIIDEKTKQPIITRVIAHDEELGQLASKLRNLSNEDFMAEIRAEYGQLDEAVVKVKDLQKVVNKDVVVDVDIKTDNAKDGVKDFVEETKTESPETQPLETKTDIAKSEITNFIIWVNTQKPNLELSVESSQAQQAVNNFVQWASSKTIRIPIVTYQANASGGLIAPIQRLASGGTFTGSGRVAGYDATDSDKVTAMLTGGEYVIKREAVDNIGLDVLHNINNMTVKGYSQGGQVSSGGESGVQPINLNIGGNSFKMTSDRETAEALQRFLESEGGL